MPMTAVENQMDSFARLRLGPVRSSQVMPAKTREPSFWLVSPLCILFLTWPALWNRYPIVFSDTGTYLSQAVHHYLGWDRPLFYSVFIWPLHLGLTTWPVVLVQSALTVLVLDLTRRALGVSRWWLPPLTAFLAVTTSLPWIVSELMPDLFTPLLILLLSLLIVSSLGFRLWQRMALIALAAFMIATQQSSVPLAFGLLTVIIPLRWFCGQVHAGPPVPRGMFVTLAPVLAPLLAVAALMAVNAAAFGRVSLSPYGNVFVMARVIYDGPGMTVLRRDCPERGWRLCPYLDRFPPTADEFLWDKSSPIMLAGGHKAVSAEADAIIRAAMREEPAELLATTWNNTIEQLTRFESGDGLEVWEAQVGPWIDGDFPARESAAFHAARQQMGDLSVPPPLGITHRLTALAGIVAALVLLPIAWRRRHAAAWYLIVALLALPVSAAITGGLSTPHDRYQSRIVWLPACVAFLTVPALFGWPRRGRG
jgi:drug/metabolite transporter superfamily protein YnfA